MKFPWFSRTPTSRSSRKTSTETQEEKCEDLLRHRTVELSGMIDDALAERVIAQLLFLQMSDGRLPIHLVIDSLGGSVTASLAILDTMERFVKNPVHTSCRRQAFGMGLVILGAGAKGFRRAHTNATLGLTRIETRSAPLTPQTKEFVEKLHRRLITIVAAASNQSEEDVAKSMEEEHQFTAAGLRAFGLIDLID